MSFGSYGLPLDFGRTSVYLKRFLWTMRLPYNGARKTVYFRTIKFVLHACNEQMLFVQRNDGIDGSRLVYYIFHASYKYINFEVASLSITPFFARRWRCSKHAWRKSASIWQNLWLSQSHLSLGTILELTYLWSEEFPVHTAVTWSEVSEKSVIDWYNFCRAKYMLRNPTVIGGPGKK